VKPRRSLEALQVAARGRGLTGQALRCRRSRASTSSTVAGAEAQQTSQSAKPRSQQRRNLTERDERANRQASACSRPFQDERLRSFAGHPHQDFAAENADDSAKPFKSRAFPLAGPSQRSQETRATARVSAELCFKARTPPSQNHSKSRRLSIPSQRCITTNSTAPTPRNNAAI
jgi:hypothetical protein